MYDRPTSQRGSTTTIYCQPLKLQAEKKKTNCLKKNLSHEDENEWNCEAYTCSEPENNNNTVGSLLNVMHFLDRALALAEGNNNNTVGNLLNVNHFLDRPFALAEGNGANN